MSSHGSSPARSGLSPAFARGLGAALLALCLLSVLLQPAVAAAGGLQVFVSTTGSDTNAGTLAAPLATFGAAQKALCTRRGGDYSKEGAIVLRSGVYSVSSPLLLTAADNNTVVSTHSADLAAGKGRAVLSGGVPITGWQPVTVNGHSVLRAKLPPEAGGSSSQLFVNGARRPRARSPNIGKDTRGLVTSVHRWASPLVPMPDNGGACPPVNSMGFVYNGTAMDPSWTEADDIWLLTFHAWTAKWHKVMRVFPENRTVLFTPESRNTCIGQYARQGGQRYIIENAKALLDEPGEWYLDNASRTLLYYPLANESASSLQVVVPLADVVLEISGAADVTLSNIALAHGTDGGGQERAKE